MKILFTTMPHLGHFHPLVELARALQERHRVHVASAPAFAGEILRAGLEPLAAGLDGEETVSRLAGRCADEPIEMLERRRRVISTEVATPQMVCDLERIVPKLQPDLLIHEEGELAAPIVARRFGIPCVTVGWPAPLMSQERAALVVDSLNGFIATSTPPGSAFTALWGDLMIDTCPPRLQAPWATRLATYRWPMRPSTYDGGGRVPAWLQNELDGGAERARPRLCLTFGTVPAFNRLPGDMCRLLDSLEDEAIEIVVTTGRNNQPGLLGSRPAHVFVERWVPYGRLFSQVDAVVTHGGAGTVLAALSHGIPMLILPRGADSQARLARACEQQGAAIVVHTLDRDTVRSAATRLLGEDRYRQAARRIALEMETLPRPGSVVQRLEELVG